jgi:2-methylcitrate dehydratase PrpD
VPLRASNGQLWSFIHLAGAACGAARVLGLDAARTADAVGIALAQPNYGLFPGFMGPGSKLLTAATPAGAGLGAAQLAARGLTGCRTILEDPGGFLRHFSFHALPQMLSGWGDAWVTETLAIKPYPGCAYIDTTIDALRDLLAESGPLPVESIASVEVSASMLTMEMDRLSHEHEDRAHLSPVNVNFNIPINRRGHAPRR